MKNVVFNILIILIVSASCNSQNDNIKTITAFMENIVMNTLNDGEKMHAFLKIHKDSLKENTKTDKLIQLNIQFLRDEINTKNNKFEILTFKAFKRKKAFENYNIIYENTDEVYCIVHEEHFITPVIIDENNKIITFFTGIVKNKNRIVPYILE